MRRRDLIHVKFKNNWREQEPHRNVIAGDGKSARMREDRRMRESEKKEREKESGGDGRGGGAEVS